VLDARLQPTKSRLKAAMSGLPPLRPDRHEGTEAPRRTVAAGDPSPRRRCSQRTSRLAVRSANAAVQLGVRSSTVKRHLADLRARSGLSTEQLIYAGRASGRLVVPSLEPH
jgi:hypothetical protein